MDWKLWDIFWTGVGWVSPYILICHPKTQQSLPICTIFPWEKMTQLLYESKYGIWFFLSSLNRADPSRTLSEWVGQIPLFSWNHSSPHPHPTPSNRNSPALQLNLSNSKPPHLSQIYRFRTTGLQIIIHLFKISKYDGKLTHINTSSSMNQNSNTECSSSTKHSSMNS